MIDPSTPPQDRPWSRRDFLASGVRTGLRLLPVLLLGNSLWSGRAQAGDAPTSSSPGDPSTQIPCPQCSATGVIPCTAHCNHGQVRCPGNCLKPDDRRWHVEAVPGFPPDLKWIDFPWHDAHRSGVERWSTHHCGQVIVLKNGHPTNIGNCPICHGKTTVDCKVCKGLGHLVCPLCAGKKTTTPAHAAAYEQHMREEREKLAIHLNDGRTVYGKIIGSGKDTVIIRTEDKQLIEEKISNIPEALRPSPSGDGNNTGTSDSSK